MQAWLMSKELWMLVDNEESCPHPQTWKQESNGKNELRRQLESYTSQLNKIKSPTFTAYSVIPFASGHHSVTFTCPRSQEQDLTPMMNSFPSENSQMSHYSHSVLELMSLCKIFKIFDQQHSLSKTWMMNCILWL